MAKNTVIIVLGGGNPIDGSFPEHAQERVRVGIKEYRQLQNAKLLFSGNRCPAFDRPPPNTEAKMMRAMAILDGVPDSDMSVEQGSRHTIENALYTRLALESHEVPDEVVVVTSDFHIPRVKMVFDRIYCDLDTTLRYIPVKTAKLGEQNLFDKRENEQKQVTRFNSFLDEIRTQNKDLKSLFEWKQVIDEFY